MIIALITIIKKIFLATIQQAHSPQFNSFPSLKSHPLKFVILLVWLNLKVSEFFSIKILAFCILIFFCARFLIGFFPFFSPLSVKLFTNCFSSYELNKFDFLFLCVFTTLQQLIIQVFLILIIPLN